MMLLTAGNTGVLSGQKTCEAEQAGGFVRICEILQDTRRRLASSLLGNGWAMKIPGRSGGRFGNAGRMADGAYSSEDGRQNGMGYLFTTNHFGKSEYLQWFGPFTNCSKLSFCSIIPAIMADYPVFYAIYIRG